MIGGLLSGQRPDGGFGVHPYSKWMGAHWRLISLVELGIPRANRAGRAAADTVLDWIAAPTEPLVIRGKERRHASMEGNALAVCCRLGLAQNRRVRRLVDVLLRSQWPDGGWNCDQNAGANRSSFHESLAPIWGLTEFHRATGDTRAADAARRGVELLLEHHMFQSARTGEVILPESAHPLAALLALRLLPRLARGRDGRHACRHAGRQSDRFAVVAPASGRNLASKWPPLLATGDRSRGLGRRPRDRDGCRAGHAPIARA